MQDEITDYYRITYATTLTVYFLFSMQNLQILVCYTESYAVIQHYGIWILGWIVFSFFGNHISHSVEKLLKDVKMIP